MSISQSVNPSIGKFGNTDSAGPSLCGSKASTYWALTPKTRECQKYIFYKFLHTLEIILPRLLSFFLAFFIRSFQVPTSIRTLLRIRITHFKGTTFLSEELHDAPLSRSD